MIPIIFTKFILSFFSDVIALLIYFIFLMAFSDQIVHTLDYTHIFPFGNIFIIYRSTRIFHLRTNSFVQVYQNQLTVYVV